VSVAGTLTVRGLLGAYVLDLVIGDSERLPHPTRLIGYAIRRYEEIVRGNRLPTPGQELALGTVLALTLTAATYAATALLLSLARRVDRRLGIVLDIALAKTTLATRNLHDEVVRVTDALERGDLERARVRLSRIVGRDTQDLDERHIARAAIETVAESLCDGVVAPLCALALGGTPAAMAFKAISTLDSMVGHIEAPYTFFGRASARFDDLANFVPARLTALLIAGAAAIVRADGTDALRIWLRDGSLHHSPNAGQSEAAMAGALRVRLGGPNRYGGLSREGAFLGAEFPAPSAHHIRAALRITLLASACAAALAVTLRSALRV
jgi:adenosylcobinamide-phosphate synthase